MVQDIQGPHHFHKRKRIHQKLEKYPHPEKWKRLLDRVIYVIAFVGPIMTIPQVIKIWGNKTAEGVSLISWATYVFVSVFWLVYGVVHREKPIILSSVGYLLLQVLIVVGAVVYS